MSALSMIFHLLLLAVVGILVHKLSVFVVEGYGISAGLVLLALMFIVGHRLSARYDL